jgi:hypothetical protein
MWSISKMHQRSADGLIVSDISFKTTTPSNNDSSDQIFSSYTSLKVIKIMRVYLPLAIKVVDG